MQRKPVLFTVTLLAGLVLPLRLPDRNKRYDKGYDKYRDKKRKHGSFRADLFIRYAFAQICGRDDVMASGAEIYRSIPGKRGYPVLAVRLRGVEGRVGVFQ